MPEDIVNISAHECSATRPLPAISGIQNSRIPKQSSLVSLLGVDYIHMMTSDGGELYLTRYGAGFWEHLLPENWLAKDWFKCNRQRMTGTSMVYRVPTKQIQGIILDLLVKWSRVGEEIPIDALTIVKFIHAEFNCPFEEFAAVMELRKGDYGPPGIHIRTQKPLGIYVPAERLELWQTGRSESKMAAKKAQSPGVELDIQRQYVVIYGWIKGFDLVEVADRLKLTGAEREQLLAGTTSLAIHELEQKGYRVVDMKPAHIIVRLNKKNEVLRDKHGQVAYAVVDYELLERTMEHEKAVRSFNRRYYLEHMAKRFEVNLSKPMPPHLKVATIFGVEYIQGRVESTGGWLWVVGRDPDLFNYFLPERWRSHIKIPLSKKGETYETRTKDNIILVWRVSRLGLSPANTDHVCNYLRVKNYGYNSPFEEFCYALELAKAGMPIVNPRAIYMTRQISDDHHSRNDLRRYEQYRDLKTSEGHPILNPLHDYITLWGFWNGPDEHLAHHDGEYYRAMNLKQAWHKGLMKEGEISIILERAAERMHAIGFEHLNIKPEHLLIAITPEHQLCKDSNGGLEIRLCNFSLVTPHVSHGILPEK